MVGPQSRSGRGGEEKNSQLSPGAFKIFRERLFPRAYLPPILDHLPISLDIVTNTVYEVFGRSVYMTAAVAQPV